MVLFLWMIIQVICEVFPVSSSGHVSLFLDFAKAHGLPINFVDNLWAYDFFLQSVSVVVFFVFFFASWWKLVIQKPISLQVFTDRKVWGNIFDVFKFGCIVDGITALSWVLGIENLPIPLIGGFFVTGMCLLFSKNIKDRPVDLWQLQHGVVLGCVQSLALISGVSRFATTFVALRYLGYKNDQALPVSFLVQWPLIAAGSLKGLLTLKKQPELLTQIFDPSFLFAMVVAGTVSYFLLMWVQSIIKQNKFWMFGIYMILPMSLAVIVKVIS